jgi:hypothetical protein
MDAFVLEIFQHEVEFQAKVIVACAYEIEISLIDRGTDRSWRTLQNLLVSAANISKLLWGSRGGREAERAELRQSLGVGDDSPMKDTDLRNDFEHFDERVERHYAATDQRIYLGRNIGPPGFVNIQGMLPGSRFQHFDPATGMVTFWEHSVSVREIVQEAQRLLGAIQAAEAARRAPRPPAPPA